MGSGRVSAAQESRNWGFLPLVIFLAVVGVLSYVILAGIGPVWLRAVIMFVLVGTVLVIAGLGLRDHLRDTG